MHLYPEDRSGRKPSHRGVPVGARNDKGLPLMRRLSYCRAHQEQDLSRKVVGDHGQMQRSECDPFSCSRDET
jgi:hypothetical protein